MDDDAFDRALVAAAFDLAARQGWRRVSATEAARAAELSLPRARARFAGRSAILLRFGRMADQAALTEAPSEGTVRDRLFDLLMRRIDALQAHRAGVLALLETLPADPATTVMLALATKRSMRWMLDAAGVPTGGLGGELRVRGLVAVWLWIIRAWSKDASIDLAATMAALDTALARAEKAAAWCAEPRLPKPGNEIAPPIQEPPPEAAAEPGAPAG